MELRKLQKFRMGRLLNRKKHVITYFFVRGTVSATTRYERIRENFETSACDQFVRTVPSIAWISIPCTYHKSITKTSTDSFGNPRENKVNEEGRGRRQGSFTKTHVLKR